MDPDPTQSSDEHVPWKDRLYCFVPSCSNNSGKNRNLVFIPIPNAAKQEWCSVLNARCPKRSLYICEAHLNLEEDVENYFAWKFLQKRPKLRLRLPTSLVQEGTEDIVMIEPMSKIDKGTSYKNPQPCHKSVCTRVVTTSKSIQCSIIGKFYEQSEDVTSIDESLPSTQGSIYSTEVSDDSSLKEVRGDAPPKYNNFLISLVLKKPHVYIGLPRNYLWLLEVLALNFKIKNVHILLTLYKIKCNLPFNQIADMFEISSTTIWRVFPRIVKVLSKFFKQFIFSPSIFHVKTNLPSSFTTNQDYSNVYCIIDCFEIEIEKPSDPIHQALTWSQYKSCNTIKYLLSTTPDGFINFVSPGFGGRTSDAVIVEKSDFRHVLPPSCTVLADRGFKHIDTLLARKNIKLLRPPSVSKGIQMTKQEAIKSKVIASLRIHVERVIRRIRLFKFLKPHSVVNSQLIQYLDNIVIIASGLINLQAPIVKI